MPILLYEKQRQQMIKIVQECIIEKPYNQTIIR
jgi:hypothetical protein